VDRVNEQVGINEANGYSDKRQMGVRTSPKLMISFACIVFSGLHASIEIGGVLVNKLVEFIDVDMEHIPLEEFQLRKTKLSASIQIELLQADEKEWNKSADGGWLLNNKRRRSKKLSRELSQADNAAWLEEKNQLDTKILTLEAAWMYF
jgi:hypothetical protein